MNNKLSYVQMSHLVNLYRYVKKNTTNLIMQFGYCEGNIREFFISSPCRNPDITALDRLEIRSSYHVNNPENTQYGV